MRKLVLTIVLAIFSSSCSVDNKDVESKFERKIPAPTPVEKAFPTSDLWSVSPPISESWKKIETDDFTFYVPNSLQGGQRKGIDSTIWHYQNDEIELSIEFAVEEIGFKDVENEKNFRQSTTQIRGKTAYFATYSIREKGLDIYPNKKIVAAIIFNGLCEADCRLSFYIYCSNEECVNKAKKIFQTIEIKRQQFKTKGVVLND